MTQIERVQRHLEENRNITSLQAFNDYGVTRLADIIYKLRRRGMNIDTITIPVMNRYGDTCYVAMYELHNEEYGCVAIG